MIPCQVAYPYIGNKRRHTKSAKIMWLNGDERRIFTVMTLFETQKCDIVYPVTLKMIPCQAEHPSKYLRKYIGLPPEGGGGGGGWQISY